MQFIRMSIQLLKVTIKPIILYRTYKLEGKLKMTFCHLWEDLILRLYKFLQYYESQMNRSLIQNSIKTNSINDLTNYDSRITTSKNILSSTIKNPFPSITNDDRKQFIIRSIERFIGYNIIYIGLLFAFCLTSERCIAVIFPMKAGNCLTIRRTRIVIILAVCMSILVHGPQLIKEIFLLYENPTELFQSGNGLILSYRSTYERFYVISSLFICVFMLILNFLLLWKIRSYRKSLRMTKHTKKVERNEVNVSLLIVVLIFFQLPHNVFVIIISFITREVYLEDFTTITRTSVIIRLLYIIQSAFNFVIYCLFAKRFREIMHIHCIKMSKKFCRKNCGDKEVSCEPKNVKSIANFLNIEIEIGKKTDKSTSL
ncbi:FMRFamide receptor-like [Mytilus trossulus]|uniref:FMRFamide receptor-like n=1 Tax=Mytilus trossulus TaxID=6551 RepID=UPI003006E536